MCLGGHSSQDLRQHMKEERNNSPMTNRQGGTDIDLLPISGSSGEGVSTVIIFIVVIILLSLGAVALWFLWRCIRECNRGSDNERILRKTRQKFSTLLDKQDRALQRIAELEERFKLQAECLQADKARILQMLHGQQYPSAPARRQDEAGSHLRRIKNGSDSNDSSICLLYTSPSPRDRQKSRMPSSA